MSKTVTTTAIDIDLDADFHLEKWTKGDKIILRENVGWRRTAHDSAPSRGVWGHASPENF